MIAWKQKQYKLLLVSFENDFLLSSDPVQKW